MSSSSLTTALTPDSILKLLNKLATFTQKSETKGVTRYAYSEADEMAHQYMINQLHQSNLQVRQDQAGNIFARLPGQQPMLPAIATGSHLDSVPNGGKYDGILGVVAGFYALTQFKPQQLKRSLELIIFRAEESSRFGIACAGSKIVTNNVDLPKWQISLDDQNKNIFQAMQQVGYTSQQLAQAVLADDSYAAFVELHIEQGQCLEKAQRAIGIVSGIAAPTRYQIDIFGQADHSGATPMDQRQDALVLAAYFITLINQLALQELAFGTVATVGKLTVFPNAMNVIPGHVQFYVDIRGVEMDSIKRVISGLQQALVKQNQTSALRIDCQQLTHEHPVKLDSNIITTIQHLCQQQNIAYLDMPSGAGHDAMYMAQKFPSAMIFVPSQRGISHHPDEYTAEHDIILGAHLLTQTLATLANQE